MKYILSYKVRPYKGGITMHDTMLTYSQWERRFKRALKKDDQKEACKCYVGNINDFRVYAAFLDGHGLVVTRMLIDRKEP